MQFAQLTHLGRRRRVHHQVAGLLVFREHHDFAQILLIGQHHHDTVHARRDAAVRRGAIAESVEHAAKGFFDHVRAITGELEGFQHDVRAVVPDGARGQLDTVTDDVVLPGFQAQKRLMVVLAERHEVFGIHLRHGERVVGELHLLVLVIPFIHGEIDDPAEAEDVLLKQIKLTAHHVARLAREAGEGGRFARSEEDRVASLKAQLGADRIGAFGANILGDRAAPSSAPFSSRQKM